MGMTILILILVLLCIYVFGCKPVNQNGVLNKDIGIATPHCPYCGIELKKFPGRKTKCKNCNNFIYVRTRPYDNKKILIKEDEILDIEIEWEKKNGTYEFRQKERNELLEIKQQLMIQRKTNSVSDNDVKWIYYQQKRLRAAHSKQWSNYGFYTEQMAQLLYNEQKYQAALEHYLEAEYFSMCCGGNEDGFMSKSQLIQFPNLLKQPFLSYVYDCIENLALNEKEIERIFMNMIIINAPYTLTRQETWKYIKQKLK